MNAGPQGTTPLTEDELVKAIKSGEINPDMIEDHKPILVKRSEDPKNVQISQDPGTIESGWYDPELHHSYLILMIKASFITGYEIDKTIHFDNDLNPLYTIFTSSNDCIHIYRSDYDKIAQEALLELESGSVSFKHGTQPVPKINYRVKFENSKSE